jgi:hypothetical protein
MSLLKIAQNVARPIFAKITTSVFSVDNSTSKVQAQSEQSPKMRKFGQSGHPDEHGVTRVTDSLK